MKIIAFDMDGTLIRNTDSVTFLCRLNNADPIVLDEINQQEDIGAISWIEADYARARLIRGLSVKKIREAFDTHIRLIGGLRTIMDYLREKQYRIILVTAGPRQVADILVERYHFDNSFGSDFEVTDGKFTGRILSHMGLQGKSKCLETVCLRERIPFKNCIAVGDSNSDIDLFRQAGLSIAINSSSGLEQYAAHALHTEDLTDILPILKSE